METPTKDAVREALNEFYKEEQDEKHRAYVFKIMRVASVFKVDSKALEDALDTHEVASAPERAVITDDQVKHVLGVLKEISGTVLYKMEHMDLPEFYVTVDIKDDEEPVSLEAMKHIARKLLNVNVTSMYTDTFVSDGDTCHEWKVIGKGWADPVRGAELQRIRRLKRARENILSLENSLLEQKKKLLEYGAAVCTCADAALAKSDKPPAPSAAEPSS
jgi:hypothetical protein